MILLRRYLIYFFIIVLVAISFTYVSAKLFPRFAYIENDIWRILPSPGDPNRDIYTRAAVAQYGTFALKKPESAYFHADIDIDNQKLNGNCVYKLSGEKIEAKWWSITAYGSDGYLMYNSENNFSFNSEEKNIKTAEKFGLSEYYEIFFTGYLDLLTERNSSNWIKVEEDSDFSLVLRIYLPGEEFFSNLRRVNLPIIEKIKCTE